MHAQLSYHQSSPSLVLPVLHLAIVTEHDLLLVLLLPAVEAGVGVVLLEQVLLVLLGLLQLEHCLLGVLLLVDDVVEVVHPFRALVLGGVAVTGPDAALLQEEPEDGEDAQDEHCQVQLVVGRNLVDVQRLQDVLQDGQHQAYYKSNHPYQGFKTIQIYRNEEVMNPSECDIVVVAAAGEREGEDHLLAAVGLHAEVVEEEGRDVEAEVGGVDEEEHLEGLRTLHADVPLLQRRHLLLQTPPQRLRHLLQLEQLHVVAVDESHDHLLDYGDPQSDDVHGPHPLRDVVVPQQPQQVRDQQHEGKTCQHSAELRSWCRSGEVFLHVFCPLVSHSAALAGVVGEVELRDHSQGHLHHGGVGGRDADVVGCEEGVGLHLVDLGEELSDRPLLAAVFRLLPEIQLVVEGLVVMLVVGAFGFIGCTDGNDGDSFDPGDAVGLALWGQVDLLVADVKGGVPGGDGELGDGAILGCFYAITAAQNLLLPAALPPLPLPQLLPAELDGLTVPPEDLLVTDAIGVDGGEGLQGDGQLRQGAVVGEGQDGDAQERPCCEEGGEVVEAVGDGIEM